MAKIIERFALFESCDEIQKYTLSGILICIERIMIHEVKISLEIKCPWGTKIANFLFYLRITTKNSRMAPALYYSSIIE